MARIVDALHTVYHTLLPTRANHVQQLTPDLHRALDGFLRLEADGSPGSPATTRPAGT